jgi:hypothetical protein
MVPDRTAVFRRARGSVVKSMLAWLVILGLAGVVFWLASERNGRQYYLLPEGGKLVVEKGMTLPLGRRSIEAEEPALANTYAPLALPSGAPIPQERVFTDRAGLDQAIYDLLAKWTRDDLASEEPEKLQRGLDYVSRAEKLAGLSASQRDDLALLRAESGFYQARGLISRGAETLRLAREKLRIASETTGRYAAEASVLLRRIDPIVGNALELAREAAGARPGTMSMEAETPTNEESGTPVP